MVKSGGSRKECGFSWRAGNFRRHGIKAPKCRHEVLDWLANHPFIGDDVTRDSHRAHKDDLEGLHENSICNENWFLFTGA